LNNAPGLYDLTVNPLLLTMIANVHRHCGELPDNRIDLYDQICQAMLWRRQEAKKLSIALDGEKKEALLRGLAFTMMQRKVRDLSRAGVLAEIAPALHRISRKLTTEEFLTDIGSNGLLIERESGVYSFAHQTFQEYLAAAHIRDKGLSDVLVGTIDDVWWRETTLLYTARSNVDAIVRACLDSASVTALSLAFDCAEQGSEIASEIRDRLNDIPTTAFASDTDRERRRLIACVLLTRHLRHLVQTGNGDRVCPRPITIGLYQLYQQDTQSPAPERATHLEFGTQEPITGVRGSDAVAFVRWVNGITGSDTIYRLPNLAEINDSALQRTLTTPMPGTPPHSVWLEPNDERSQPELWTPTGADHPHLVDAATLASHVKDDAERSTPTLIRLLLLRSIVTVHVLISVFERYLVGIRNHYYGPDPARDPDLARTTYVSILDLVLTLARDHALDLALTLDLTLALDRALDHALARARDLTHARDLTRDLTRDHAHALGRARRLAKTRAPALDHAVALDGALDLDDALDRANGLGLLFDRDRELEHLRARVMGCALTHALTRVLHRNTSAATWLAKFAQELIDETGVAKADYVVSPDTLVDKVHSGHQALMNLFGPPDGAAPLPWAHQVVRNLQETALPIFTRQQRLTKDTATAIRIAALCLAAEADVRDAHQLGDTFREIAAGVTLLERRATGQAVPTETIMLAIR
jgi:hypothetical protein